MSRRRRLPEKPQPTFEGLPAEIWTQICHSRSSYSDGEVFIIDPISLSSLRVTSRMIHWKTQDAFLQRHLAFSKFSLMPWSLEILKELSENVHLCTYVRELEFGPEVLNTNLVADLQYIKDPWEEPSTGCPHPESYIHVDSTRPVWPIVKLPEPLWKGITGRDAGSALVVRWNLRGGFHHWLQRHGDTLKRLIEHQNRFRAAPEYIQDAIAKFTNLRSIKINPRPIGTYYEERFAQPIERSRGTMSLSRQLGAHEIEVTTDPAPSGSISLLDFSLDGLLFMEYYAEIVMLENIFMILSTVDLGKLTVDLTITAANLLPNGKIFDTGHSNWRVIAPQIRSLTFDCAMTDVGGSHVPDLLTWIAEMLLDANAVEHFYGRSCDFDYSMLRIIFAQSSWTCLRTLHLFRSRSHKRSLLKMLLRHRSTLEDVSLTRVTITGMNIAAWRKIFVAMKGIHQLERVTLDQLELQGNLEKSGNAPLSRNSKPVTSDCLKTKGHENVRLVLDTATERIILLPGRDITLWQVHFEVPP
jgi:hypothetical protein